MRRLFLGGTVASMVALSGCMGLEIANAVVQTGNTATSDLVSAERMTVVSNDLESATPATYKPYLYRRDQDCLFSAFVVPYERTWPEEIKQPEGEIRILPPEPGKIAGYIAVIYKKTCPGAVTQPVLRAGRQSTTSGTGTIFTRAFSSDQTTYFMNTWDSALDSRDMIDPDIGEKRKWWPQVIARLTRLARTDPKVKTALAYNLDLFVQATPDQAEALRTMAQ
jgi:hypothetical protein